MHENYLLNADLKSLISQVYAKKNPAKEFQSLSAGQEERNY